MESPENKRNLLNYDNKKLKNIVVVEFFIILLLASMLLIKWKSYTTHRQQNGKHYIIHESKYIIDICIKDTTKGR